MDKRVQAFLMMLNNPMNLEAITHSKGMLLHGIQPDYYKPDPIPVNWYYFRWFYKLNKTENEVKIYGPNAPRYEGEISGLRITFGVYRAWEYSTQSYVSFDQCHNPYLKIHYGASPKTIQLISRLAVQASNAIKLPEIKGRPDTNSSVSL